MIILVTYVIFYNDSKKNNTNKFCNIHKDCVNVLWFVFNRNFKFAVDAKFMEFKTLLLNRPSVSVPIAWKKKNISTTRMYRYI